MLLRYIKSESSKIHKDKIDLSAYKPKKYFLTKTEKSFFKILNKAVDNEYYVMPQVNLDKLIRVNAPYNKNYTFRNKIDRKSVDFVLCDKQNICPVLAIELDDSSHDARSRQKRDKFVNQIFEQINLPLVRIPAQQNYDVKTLKEQVRLED